MTIHKKTIPFFAGGGVLVTAAIWGFAFVVVKDSLNAITPLWMMAVRFTIAAAAMAVIFANKLRTMTRMHFIRGAVLGFLLFSSYAFQTIGCTYTTAGKNAFLTAAYVVLVPLFGWAFGEGRPRFNVFAAAAIALTGIALLSLGTQDMGAEESIATASGALAINKGDVLTLFCAVFFALHIIYMEKSTKGGGIPSLRSVCRVANKVDGGMGNIVIHSTIQFAFAALFSWIGALLFEGGIPIAALRTSSVMLSMLYLGILSTMVGFVLQNVGLKYVPPFITSLLMSFESVFGVLFSALCLGERLTVRMAIGCAMIFTAVILAQVKGDGSVCPKRLFTRGRRRK